MDKNKEINSKTALLILFVIMIGSVFCVLFLDKLLTNLAGSINTFQFPVLFQQQEAGNFVKLPQKTSLKSI